MLACPAPPMLRLAPAALLETLAPPAATRVCLASPQEQWTNEADEYSSRLYHANQALQLALERVQSTVLIGSSESAVSNAMNNGAA